MAETPQQKTIPEHLAGQRLDLALARMFPEYSRSRLKDWVQKGLVTVDDRACRPRDAVMAGATVVLTPVEEVVSEAEPEPIALDIRFEDDDLLIVNKPAGLVVHPGSGNSRGTLMNGLLHYAPALANLPRAGIVHRLDKETSGVLLIGKHLKPHTELTRMLAERNISRHYVAVCTGVLTGGGRIDAPIGRHPVDRTRMAVTERGKPAVTHYRVRQRFRAHTYISVQLETGRTHQIRVHFAHRRHPLVGDAVYGGRLALPPACSDELREVLRRFRRQALHALRLEFRHPMSGSAIRCEAPPPEDFLDLLGALARDAETIA